MATERWFDRSFELGLPPKVAAEILLRLRSTPSRLTNAIRDLPPEILTARPDGKWSIQENVGHLFDLEALWEQRLSDHDNGAEVLRPADLENRKTHEACHNERTIAEVLGDFAVARQKIIDRITRMSEPELARTSLHPRLRQPMSVVDLAHFVAEHDGHHLRTIDELRSRLTR